MPSVDLQLEDLYGDAAVLKRPLLRCRYAGSVRWFWCRSSEQNSSGISSLLFMWICPIVLFSPNTEDYPKLFHFDFEHVFPSCQTMGLLSARFTVWTRVLGERRWRWQPRRRGHPRLRRRHGPLGEAPRAQGRQLGWTAAYRRRTLGWWIWLQRNRCLDLVSSCFDMFLLSGYLT